MVKDKEGKEGGVCVLESFLFGPRSEAKAEAEEGNGRSRFSVQIVQKPQRPSAPAQRPRTPAPVSREAAAGPLGPACLVYLILTGSERERDS